jgi:hypothetical protein
MQRDAEPRQLIPHSQHDESALLCATAECLVSPPWILLMGVSGSGKTSVRSLISCVPFARSLSRRQWRVDPIWNNPASLTSRLGSNIDVKQNHVRFLGGLILSLWDCGLQDAFMDSYPPTQRSTIFQHVGVLPVVYVFGPARTARQGRRVLPRLHRVSRVFLTSSIPLCVWTGEAGMVESRAHNRPRRGRLSKPAARLRPSYDLPRYRHFRPSRRQPRIIRERPDFDAVRAHERTDQGAEAA